MKHRLFLDTNIVLDLLGARDPYYLPIARIATMADNGQLTLVVSALTYATASYILTKYEGKEVAMKKLRGLRIISEISGLTEQVVEKGLNANFRDYEDALQYHCALQSACDYLLIRNGKDFRDVEIPVMTPDEYLASIGANG